MEIKMTWKCVLLMMLVSFFPSGANGQDETGQVLFRIVEHRTYDDVLDILFPREAVNKKETDWQIILRFKPSSEPESQIVIRKTIFGHEVFEYVSSDGSIFAKLNRLFTDNKEENATKMAKLIEVKKKEIKVSSGAITTWYDEFFDSANATTRLLRKSGGEFARKGSWDIRLHGTTYEIWYTHKGDQLNFVVYDEAVDQKITGEASIVRWMNKIRLLARQ